jgi:hypothetical protein
MSWLTGRHGDQHLHRCPPPTVDTAALMDDQQPRHPAETLPVPGAEPRRGNWFPSDEVEA